MQVPSTRVWLAALLCFQAISVDGSGPFFTGADTPSFAAIKNATQSNGINDAPTSSPPLIAPLPTPISEHGEYSQSGRHRLDVKAVSPQAVVWRLSF